MQTWYKVSMCIDGKWTILESGWETEMRTALELYRQTVSNREFRLEKHTMEVLDV